MHRSIHFFFNFLLFPSWRLDVTLLPPQPFPLFSVRFHGVINAWGYILCYVINPFLKLRQQLFLGWLVWQKAKFLQTFWQKLWRFPRNAESCCSKVSKLTEETLEEDTTSGKIAKERARFRAISKVDLRKKAENAKAFREKDFAKEDTFAVRNQSCKRDGTSRTREKNEKTAEIRRWQICVNFD